MRVRVLAASHDFWFNDGTGVFTHSQEIGKAWTWNVRLGDLDADGDLDAFFGNIGQDNQIWINRLAGDVDDDGEVQFADFLTLASNFGRTDAVSKDGDLNGDGGVDFADFTILANNFGQSRPRELSFQGRFDGSSVIPKGK